jgi:predicted lipid-binding transport protein (Tim44 family)
MSTRFVNVWIAVSFAALLSAGIPRISNAADLQPHNKVGVAAKPAIGQHAAPTRAQVNRNARRAAQRKRTFARTATPPIHSGLGAARELDTIKAQNKLNERQRELDRAQQHAANPAIGRAQRKFDDSQVDLQRVQPLP